MTVEEPLHGEPCGRLSAKNLGHAFASRSALTEVSVELLPGKLTCVVGPNACGKTTLLRALARIIKPSHGQVLLDGESIHNMPTRIVAKRLGLLPQTPSAPDGISVAELVGRGRYPHQSWFRQPDANDVAAVTWAMMSTGVAELAERQVDELSGGQRQRVWMAMALAQETTILLLDEPTTFLDLAHQIEVLDLLVDLVIGAQRTIVAVLHDLNQACRYANHLIVMKDGRIVAQGSPSELVDPVLLREVFSVRAQVIHDPVSGTPMIIPIGRHSG